jgi:hypothetical protein
LAGDDGGVAYFAHIGGFLAGMVLIPFFKRSDVPLFGANDTPPEKWDAHPIPFARIKQEANYRYRKRANDPLQSRIVIRDEDRSDDDINSDNSTSPWRSGQTGTRDGTSRRGRKPRGSVPGFKRRD